MIGRALLIWFVLLMVAMSNGVLREALLTPAVGAPIAHVISTLLLSALILLVAWLSIGWIAPPTRRAAALVGLFWASLVVAFEFLAGRYLFDRPWDVLLADYAVWRGRIWVLVLVTTVVAPMWAWGRLPEQRP